MMRLAADVAQDEFSGCRVGNQHRAEFAVLLEDLHLGRLDVLGAARRCRLCQRLLFGRRGTVSCQPAVSERASDDENGDNIQAGVNDFALVRGSGSGVYLRGGSLLSNVGALALLLRLLHGTNLRAASSRRRPDRKSTRLNSRP